jgi:hypothetical protein
MNKPKRMILSAERWDCKALVNCDRTASLASCLKEAGIPFRLGVHHHDSEDVLVFNIPLNSDDSAGLERLCYCRTLGLVFDQSSYLLVRENGNVYHYSLNLNWADTQISYLLGCWKRIDSDEIDNYNSWVYFGQDFYTWEEANFSHSCSTDVYNYLTKRMG